MARLGYDRRMTIAIAWSSGHEEYHGPPALARPDVKPPAGWSLELVTALHHPHHPQLSPDGQQVAFIWQHDGLSDVAIMPAAGGWPRRITTQRAAVIDWLDTGPRWSPDGRWLAWQAGGQIWVAPGDGRGAARPASPHLSTASTPVWMPDSRQLIVSVTRGECVNLALTDWQPAGPIHTTLLTWDEAGDAWDAQPAPDGRHIVYVYRPLHDLNRLELRRLTRLDAPMADGGVGVSWQPPLSLTGEPRTKDWSPRWSPDGRWIAFLSQRSGWNDIWLMRPDGKDLRQLTQGGQDVGEFVWSPDGRQLAATLNRNGAFDLVLVAVDSGQIKEVCAEGNEWGTVGAYGHRPLLPAGIREETTEGREYMEGGRHGELRGMADGDAAGGRGVTSHLAWGPAGDWLLAAYEDPTHPPDLYRITLKGGRETPAAHPPADMGLIEAEPGKGLRPAGDRSATTPYHRTALTFSQLPALEALPLVTPTRVHYTSADGLAIEAFLFRPAQPNGAAIVYPHGGPSFQYLYQWDIWAQYFVAKGYTYLAPNYRGSTGYGVAFEHANYFDWGQGDMQDCLAGARFLHTLPWIDPTRIAIAGGSYGGYLVACCLARDPDDLFACGVSRYGDAHPLTSWAQCERETRLYTEMMMGHPSRQREAYRRAAPIYEMAQVRRPILLLHGQLDDIVPPQASAEWAAALRQAGKTFEYKVYPDEPHGFLKRANEMDMLARMERFLDWYLM